MPYFTNMDKENFSAVLFCLFSSRKPYASRRRQSSRKPRPASDDIVRKPNPPKQVCSHRGLHFPKPAVAPRKYTQVPQRTSSWRLPSITNLVALSNESPAANSLGIIHRSYTPEPYSWSKAPLLCGTAYCTSVKLLVVALPF